MGAKQALCLAFRGQTRPCPPQVGGAEALPLTVAVAFSEFCLGKIL